MCGRYATTRSAADLSALFDAVDETVLDGPDVLEPRYLGPRYNVAPTDPVPVVRTDRAGQRVLERARWGLLPHWTRDPRQGARMINARAETVATAPAYARPFGSSREAGPRPLDRGLRSATPAGGRALVPADGWYEWRRLPGGGKQTYFMTPTDGSMLAFAGLWSRWGPDRLLTFTVLTTAAIGELAAVHDRMPLLLPPDRWARWLSGDPALDPPPPAFLAGLELRPVGPAVGNVRNDGPELVTRVDIDRVTDQAAPTLF